MKVQSASHTEILTLPQLQHSPIDLAAPLPVLGSDSEPSASPSNIRIEHQHHAMKVTLHWPVGATGACAQMQRAAAMIRIDTAWLATAPLDMRAGSLHAQGEMRAQAPLRVAAACQAPDRGLDPVQPPAPASDAEYTPLLRIFIIDFIYRGGLT